MKRFYEKPHHYKSNRKIYFVILDEVNFEMSTWYASFAEWQSDNTEKGRRSQKKYKSLETAQRNFDKKCKELEGKGYVLSDERHPSYSKNAIEKAQKDPKTTHLRLEVYHEYCFEQLLTLKDQLTSLELLPMKKGVGIPEKLGKFDQLEKLSITNTYSSSFESLPNNFGDLKKLKELSVRSLSTHLTALPESVSKCAQLEKIKISGSVKDFPLNLGHLKNLKEIECDQGDFQTFPASIEDCVQLTTIKISSCPQFVGNLPIEFGNIPKLKTLHITNTQLKQFPLPICNLPQIEEIGFSSVAIPHLPKEINQLKSLKRLKIQRHYQAANFISKLPDTLTLPNLEYLDIPQNNLIELPKVFNCPALKKLHLSGGKITEIVHPLQLPKLEILDLNYNITLEKIADNVLKLPALKNLLLNSCPIKNFPNQYHLPQLQSLELSQCQLESLPSKLDFPELTQFTLYQNKLSQFPTDFNFKKLKNLTLSHNQLTEIPDAIFDLSDLETLALANNQLTEVPFGLQRLKPTCKFYLYNNPLDDLPEHLQSSKREAIFQHLGWDLAKPERRKDIESKLSVKEQDALFEQYKERILEATQDQDVIDFLSFQHDEIPNRFHAHSALVAKIFAPSLEDWTEIEDRLMRLLFARGWKQDNKNKLFSMAREDYADLGYKAYRIAREAVGMEQHFFTWYKNQIGTKNEPDYEAVEQLIHSYNKDINVFHQALWYLYTDFSKDGKATIWGNAFIKKFQEDPKGVLGKLTVVDRSPIREILPSATHFLMEFALEDLEPHADFLFFERIDYLLANKNQSWHSMQFKSFRKFCKRNPQKYEPLYLKAARSKLNNQPQGQLAIDLHHFYGDKHKDLIPPLIAQGSFRLLNTWKDQAQFEFPQKDGSFKEITAREFLIWALKHYKEEIKEGMLAMLVKQSLDRYTNCYDLLFEAYGDETMLDIITEHTLHIDNRYGINNIFKALEGKDYTTYHHKLWNILKHGNNKEKIMVGRELRKHYSDQKLLKDANQYLEEKKGEYRDSGIQLLMLLNDPKAVDLLKETLQKEALYENRETIIRYLIEKDELEFLRQEILEAFDRTKGKYDKIKTKMFGDAQLPDLYWKTGKKADPLLVIHLIQNQKKKADDYYKPTLENGILLEFIDKEKSNKLGKFLFDYMMNKGGLKATNKAVYAFATALGDDSVIDPIKDLAIKQQNLVAPSILGNLPTLKSARALDAIMQYYKQKYPNIREAASNAFDRIADTMGIHRLELMDHMIPDFGFKDLFKEFDVEGEKWQAFIGANLKMAYMNEEGKIKKTMPKKASKEFKAEIKAINADIRSIAKQQKQSLEYNLITQRRWDKEAWIKHFMKKPLTFALAQSLIWGTYEDGKLTHVFGINQDQTLEDSEFDEVDLPDNSQIGMVHPIELTKEQIEAWKEYLAENEITQVFEQMDRKVFRPKEKELEEISIAQFDGKNVGDSIFRRMFYKRGWRKGSMGDGGMIDSYKKSYDAISLNVEVYLDEMYIYEGEYSSHIDLGHIYFSQKLPDPKNPELLVYQRLKIKQVPQTIYSEIRYDFDLLIEANKEANGEDEDT